MKSPARRVFLQQAGLFAVSGLAIPWLKVNHPSSTAAPTSPAAYQLQTPHQVVEMDLTSSDYGTRFTQLTSQGYRPIWLQGVNNGSGAATYSAVWVRDGITNWIELRDMTAAEYQANFTTYGGQGYRPISVSGYQSNGTNLFAAIWLHDPGTDYVGIHNATNAQYQTFVNNAVAGGYWPQVVDGYPVGTNPSASDDYISIWAKIVPTAAEARHGLTAADYQTFFNTYAALGYHVTCVSGYEINGATYFAAMMVKDSVSNSVAHHNFLPGDLYNQAVAHEQADYQPTVIESYDNGSTRNFAGVWIKKARTWTATGAANPDLTAFDTTVQSFMQARNIPAGSLAVTRNSRLVYARGYRWDGYSGDPVFPDSIFRIASLTKPLTATAVMRLVQEGHLHLGDKLTSLLSLGTPADPRMNDITVLNLLQHQGGWNRDTTSFDPMFADQTIASNLGVSLPISQQNIITYMTNRLLDFAPGTLYDYSNYGYLLLGRIIAAVTGLPYATYMQQSVFTPLGITRIVQGASEFEHRKPGEVTYFTTNPGLYANVRRANAPANAMISYGNFNLENMDSHGAYLASAVDLACFATAFDATGLYPILTQNTIDQVFAVPAIGKQPDQSWYGCGWAVRQAGSGLNTWHNGSLPGTSTLMVRRFDGLDWVVLFDQRDDPSGLDYGAIDGALHTAANSITHWPTGDLFPSYNLPSRYERFTYLPYTTR